MTSRERVIKTFRFERTDRAPLDFMENWIWPELMEFFKEKLGLADAEAVYRYFDVDFRWYSPAYIGPEGKQFTQGNILATYSDQVINPPLREAETIADICRYPFPDPSWWDGSGIKDYRERHPEQAVVMSSGLWMAPCCAALDLFGMEEALVKMIASPELLDAFVQRQHEFLLELQRRLCAHAEGVADIYWLGDDYASQQSLIMSPELWRRFFKEPLRQQAELAHQRSMNVMLHSCGAVREILPDLIAIGVDCLETFQTSAEGMDAESIARDFGGKITFYGGIDCQRVLSFGSEEDVRREVRRNLNLFAECGGYIVANAHIIETIKPENMVAMLEEARKITA